MKKLLLMLAVLVSMPILVNCGGGSSSTGNVEKSMVTITVGDNGKSAHMTIQKDTVMARLTSYLGDISLFHSAVAAIPVDVKHVVITVSAADMPTITRDIPITGQPSITESFIVPNGSNRHIQVDAKDAAGKVLFGKDAYVNLLDGRSIRLTFQLDDKAPPTFGGLLSATPVSATRIDLAWSPASDLVATTANIVYLVYMATTSGGESFSSPSFTTSAGATTYSVTGLNPDTTYSFVVRADDGAGNREANTIEKSARTLQPPDITPPQFAGLKSAVASATNSGKVDLSWSAASDNVTIAAGIVYRIYMATTPGGENFAAPSFTSSVGATAYSVTGLNPDTTYFFVVRAVDGAGNAETNTIEKFAKTIKPPDTTPPVFAGLKSAVVNATVAGQVDLSWNTALDNVTAATAIDYLIYIASTPGGENFAAPSFITSPGSTSFPLTNLSPGTHYAVVRSRDAAGNIDTNTVERSATIITSGISVINSCNPVETVFSFTFSTVAVHSTATIANTGSETVNGISCSDNKSTNLAGVPTSLAPGASATITGSYSPPVGASNGPYNDTVTCSGTGTQSGLAVTATGPTSCNFAPSISLANVGCARDAGLAQIGANITNTGNETVTLVSCADTMGSSVPAPTMGVLNPSVSFNFLTNAVTTLATSDTLTCTGVGAFSKTLVSRTATTPCN